MKTFLITSAALLALAAPALASGDAAEGEKTFKKCKSCHMIESPEGETIVKGGKVGPNLYGIVGRVAGSVEDYKYGDGLVDAQAAGFVWTEEAIAEYVVDPKAYNDHHGWTPKSKMSFKLKDGGEDVAAYLASVAPPAE
jgi:cytochrome c